MQSGLYNSENNLIKSWDELISLGLDITSDNNSSCARKVFINNKLSGKLIVPPSVKTVGKKKFENCKSLTGIIFQGMMENINNFAFKDCSKLESVVFEKSVKEIGTGAFFRCKKLKNIELGNKITVINEDVFSECESLEKINFPETLKKIDNFAFTCCRSLVEINIPKSCYFMPNSFRYCFHLKRINIDSKNENFCVVDNVVFSKDMKKLLFYLSGKTDEIYNVPECVETIGSYAFESSNLQKIVLPNSLLTIEEKAFEACVKLTDIELPCNLKTLGDYVFEGTNIKELILPASLKNIGSEAFSDSNIVSVTIPNELKNIEDGIFHRCMYLEQIHVTKNWADIHPYFSERYANLLVFTVTIDDLIEENKSFKEINKIFKDKNVER